MTFQRVWHVHDDKTVYSPDHRLEFTSRHPPDSSEGVAKHCRVALGVLDGTHVVWERRCGFRNGSPLALWIDDTGWSAVLYGDDQLILADPTGRAVASVGVLDQLIHDPGSNPYIVLTTAGRRWDSRPIGIFFQAGGMSCFSLRPYWGRRLILREDGDIEFPGCDDEAVVHAEIAAAMRRLETLDAPIGPPLYDLSALESWSDYANPAEAMRAAVLLGAEHVVEAAPLLEHASGIAEGWIRVGMVPESVAGSESAQCHLRVGYFGLRIICALELARLGRSPTTAATYALDGGGLTFAVRDRPHDWLEQLDRLRPGMTHDEMLQRVGPPTYLSRVHRHPQPVVWWYDGPDRSVAAMFEDGFIRRIADDRLRRWTGRVSRESELLG